MSTSLLLYTAILCCTAFEYRTADPFSLFPYQVAAQVVTWPVAITNPAYLPGSGGLLLNSTASRPYCESELSAAGLYAQYGGTVHGLQGSWNSFGADFYREQTISVKCGYRPFTFLSAGISENIFAVDISLDGLSRKIRMADTDASMLFSPYSWIAVSVIQSCIVTKINKKNTDILYPERSAGISVKPAKGFSASWNITETAAGRVNSFAAAVNPVAFFTMHGGYSRENSALAAAFGVLVHGFMFSYGLRYHPYLGYTHSVGITFAPDFSADCLDYGRPIFSRPAKKTDIRAATIDDLKGIDGLSARSAERAIMYRDKIGPVTEKALVQIGMSGDEIALFDSQIYGLQRTPRNDGDNRPRAGKKYSKRPPRGERIKNRFREIISCGVRSTQALSYSELCESSGAEIFHDTLDRDTTFSGGQKECIERTCTE